MNTFKRGQVVYVNEGGNAGYGVITDGGDNRALVVQMADGSTQTVDQTALQTEETAGTWNPPQEITALAEQLQGAGTAAAA